MRQASQRAAAALAVLLLLWAGWLAFSTVSGERVSDCGSAVAPDVTQADVDALNELAETTGERRRGPVEVMQASGQDCVNALDERRSALLLWGVLLVLLPVAVLFVGRAFPAAGKDE